MTALRCAGGLAAAGWRLAGDPIAVFMRRFYRLRQQNPGPHPGVCNEIYLKRLILLTVRRHDRPHNRLWAGSRQGGVGCPEKSCELGYLLGRDLRDCARCLGAFGRPSARTALTSPRWGAWRRFKTAQSTAYSGTPGHVKRGKGAAGVALVALVALVSHSGPFGQLNFKFYFDGGKPQDQCQGAGMRNQCHQCHQCQGQNSGR